jgi:hypothetical protein
MSKTPYEIRLDLIKMAQDQLNQRYYNQFEVAKHNAQIASSPLNEVPEFPSTEQLLLEAEKLKHFVDKADKS